MHIAHNEPEERLDSLFHKAASFAVYAIVASFVAQFIYAHIWLRLSPSVSRWLSFVPTMVMISAIPAGFIALCGIPRFGRRKLLWKGLLGLIFPIVLFVFVMYYSAYLQARIVEETQKMERQK